MVKTQTARPWITLNEHGPCACSQLRRTARKVSTFYDQALKPAGLTITQYALLVNVARVKNISRIALATQLGMDRTTLTRNLIPLEKSALLIAAEGIDRRERLIKVSPKGFRKLEQSYNLWADAQKLFSESISATTLTRLRDALTSAEATAEHLTR